MVWHEIFTGAAALSGSQFGESDGPMFLNELDCSDDDTSLLLCPKLSQIGQMSCDYSQLSGAKCFGMVQSITIKLCN